MRFNISSYYLKIQTFEYVENLRHLTVSFEIKI